MNRAHTSVRLTDEGRRTIAAHRREMDRAREAGRTFRPVVEDEQGDETTCRRISGPHYPPTGALVIMSIVAVTVVMLAASAVLRSVLTANMLVGITISAKSFTEAQSYVAPLGFLIIVPVLALQFADFFACDTWVYLIPIVNGAISGVLDAWYVALACGSTALSALLLLGNTYRSFQRGRAVPKLSQHPPASSGAAPLLRPPRAKGPSREVLGRLRHRHAT